MKKSAQIIIFNRIRKNGKNWVFSQKDFIKDFSRWEIDHSLHFLEKERKIKRILTGLYYFPEYSEILKEFVAPDMRKVADALARKYDWNIFPEGNTALNYLGLSTQIPARFIYISSGSPRKYKVNGMTLEFRHRVLTETMIKDKNAMLVVQAIKSVGQIHADTEFVNLLSKRFTYKEWVKIEKITHKVTNWVFEIIRKAKESAKNG